MIRNLLALALLASLPFSQARAAGLAGAYTVTGSNPTGAPYKGSLTVSPAGEAFKFDWNTGSQSSGIGLQLDRVVAVAVGGAECAAVLYTLGADGSLSGVWVGPQGGALGKESAVAPAGKATGWAGDYLVEGTNSSGTRYKGALGIAREGEHWRLSWRTGSNFEGYGIDADGYLGVSFGAPTCGVVLYTVDGAGNLDGRWKYYQTGVGIERAKRG